MENCYDELRLNICEDEETGYHSVHYSVDLQDLENNFSRIIVSDNGRVATSPQETQTASPSVSESSLSENVETNISISSQSSCEQSVTNSLLSRASESSRASQTSTASQTSRASKRGVCTKKNNLARRVSLRSNKGKPPKKFGFDEYVN